MKRRNFCQTAAMGSLGFSLANCAQTEIVQSPSTPPNIVIIFTDDMGYGDINYTGHPTIHTPNLNQLVHEGTVMTQFYSASSVCSPSRASLLTGRYPVRTGVIKVLFPHHNVGLPQNEITIASMLKQKGYATSCVGKWHLGHKKEFLPTSHGFDMYYGIPYSNDMVEGRSNFPPLPLMRNEEIIEAPVDQTTITKRYAEESVKFIQQSARADKPFFLYFAHTMPHVPLYRSDDFENVSKRGLYGDIIEEIDWSVGEVMKALKEEGVDDNTLVIFTSDNGPWLSKRLNGGSQGLFRSGKATTWEGGVREPFIARFPGKIPAGNVITEMGSTLDLFPTCLALAGIDMPQDRPYDGHNLLPVIMGEESEYDTFYYFYNETICAMRWQQYKLHVRVFEREFRSEPANPPQLYNLLKDPSEQYDIAAEHPELVQKMQSMIDSFQEEVRVGNPNWEMVEKL